ncbi:unnamed protein product [Closterium sp. NIES-53]
MRPVQWTCEGGIGSHADSQAGGSVEGAGSQCAWPPPLPPLARIRTRMQQAEDSQAPSSASSDLEDSSSGPAGSKEPHLVSPISMLFLECSTLHTSHRSAEESEVSSTAPAVSEDSRGPSSAPSDPDKPEDLQPVSPISRLFLDPALSTVILMAMEFEGSSMGVTELTGLVRTLLSSQPRFTSRIFTDGEQHCDGSEGVDWLGANPAVLPASLHQPNREWIQVLPHALPALSSGPGSEHSHPHGGRV